MASYLKGLKANGASGDGCCCSDNSIDRNSAIFFNNLALKLLDMSKVIEARMDELSKKVCAPQTKGVFFASIDTPVMSLGVKYEYVEYIKRYGPPQRGQFDETLLAQIRVELGITETTTTI